MNSMIRYAALCLGLTLLTATMLPVGAAFAQPSSIAGIWRFEMSSDGYKGILGRIELKTDGSYRMEVYRGELWRITTSGTFRLAPALRGDNSDGILSLTPTVSNIPADVPYKDRRTLSDNNIPLSLPADYQLFLVNDRRTGLGLCHTERQPRGSFSQCFSPWRLER